MEDLVRLDLRIPTQLTQMIDLAASIEGTTRTEFLIGAASERAKKVIEANSVVRLSARDQLLLAESLAKGAVPEPTGFIREITELYRANVESR